jgi:hypothetical protein
LCDWQNKHSLTHQKSWIPIFTDNYRGSFKFFLNSLLIMKCSKWASSGN